MVEDFIRICVGVSILLTELELALRDRFAPPRCQRLLRVCV